MSSKGKIYLIIVIIFCLTLIVSGLRNIEDERTKTLEHIIFLPASSKLLFEYNNNSQSIINSPFNQTFPIISENDLIVNDKNIYKIKEGREIEKTNSLEGTVYYYKDSVNYMLNSNQKYLKVLSDNSVNYYYLFDDNFKTTHIDSYTDSAEFKKFEERKTYGPDGKMTNIVYYNKDIEVTPCMSAESPKSFWSSLFGRGGRAKRTRRTMPRTTRRSSKSRSRHHTRSRKS